MPKLKYERPLLKRMNAGVMNKFGSASTLQPVKLIDGVPVKSLIHTFGSPVFVLSEKQIRRNYRAAVRAFNTRYPKVQFAWSYKTNYLNAVCHIFHQEGSWAEVVSGFEYRKALNNGVPGRQIIFNGPDKSAEDVLLAIENDSLLHIDHFDELYKLLSLCDTLIRKPRVAIRVNMDTGVYPQWDRFGFNYENGQAWNALTKIVTSGKLQLVGLHCHIGTYMLSTSAYAVAATKMCELAARCQNLLQTPLQYLDMGGGFASSNTLKGAYFSGADTVPAIDDYAEAITTTILNYGFKTEEMPLLILETGRALIDDAGYLLGSVVANKRLGNGRQAIVVNFGVNILFTAFWYDHKISPAQDCNPHTEDVTVLGPLCMNIDVIRESVSLPLLNPGDHVVVHKAGAYNMSQWMQFISTRPAVVLIDEARTPHQIRKAESLDYIEMPEQLPAHLQAVTTQSK